MNHYQLLINGVWTDAADGGTLNVMNPATEEVFATVARATSEDAAHAVDAAEQAFMEWLRHSPAQRGALLREAAGLVFERREQIGRAP